MAVESKVEPQLPEPIVVAPNVGDKARGMARGCSGLVAAIDMEPWKAYMHSNVNGE